MRLLRRHLAHAGTSPFYRELFSRAGFDPRRVRTLADLARLPFTTKRDLEQRGPDFLAAPAHEVVDVCESSGTTGLPVTLLQTRADLERLAYNEESPVSAPPASAPASGCSSPRRSTAASWPGWPTSWG